VSIPVIKLAKIQAQVLVSLVKALGEERANALGHSAVFVVASRPVTPARKDGA
jgi:hypothetical protein